MKFLVKHDDDESGVFFSQMKLKNIEKISIRRRRLARKNFQRRDFRVIVKTIKKNWGQD